MWKVKLRSFTLREEVEDDDGDEEEDTIFKRIQSTWTQRPKYLMHWFLYEKYYWKGEQLIFNFKSNKWKLSGSPL